MIDMMLHALVLETGLTAEKLTSPVIVTPATGYIFLIAVFTDTCIDLLALHLHDVKMFTYVTGTQPRLIGLQVGIDTAVDQTVTLQRVMRNPGPLRET